ncbi:ATP-binding protein [Streptomyces sp. NPDC060322]|uniref:ATP-binding protein n=1 Tax=Streptomyces sp. NPDC060322 TaxID=3347097 RepID=UPI003668D455
MHAERPPRDEAAALLPGPEGTGADPHEDLARELGIGTPGFTTRGLGADAESLRQARAFVRDALDRWGLHSCADDVALVAGELVSNAVCHGLRPSGRPAGRCAARLGLAHQDGTLVCAVNDPSPYVPVLRRPDECLERGRGMRIIDALSSSWGWSRPTGRGKTVWARIPVGSASACYSPASAVQASARSA